MSSLLSKTLGFMPSQPLAGLLGMSGGASGTGFSGPQSAPIVSPTTAAQADQAAAGVNQGLSNQSGFLQALQAQNGIQNQSNVFNQMQGVANGTGPNPAQAQLAQATGANIANQNAMAAGQRGANANVGLLSRQAAQQGAQTQQQSAGQAATLQANQSLNALNNLGGIANTQVAQQANATNALSSAYQGNQQNILNAIGQQNNAAVGMQSNINQSNTSLADRTMQGQQGLLGGAMQGASSLLSMADGGEVAPPPDTTSAPSGASTAAPAAKSSGGGGAGLTSLIAMMADGGTPTASTPAETTPPASANGPKSMFARFLKGATGGGANANGGSTAQTDMQKNPLYQGMASLGAGIAKSMKTDPNAPSTATISPDQQSANDMAPAQGTADADTLNSMNFKSGGKVPALLSPGERYLTPQAAQAAAEGKVDPMKAGKKVPGKPAVGGAKNSYANDTVKAELEEGGLVLPRSVTQSKNPHWAAHKFVMAHMAKNSPDKLKRNK